MNTESAEGFFASPEGKALGVVALIVGGCLLWEKGRAQGRKEMQPAQEALSAQAPDATILPEAPQVLAETPLLDKADDEPW